MIYVFPKKSQDKVGRYFHAYEFDCPCAYADCTETRIEDGLVNLLDNVRDALGRALRVTGGCRCQKHEDDLKAGGYKTSDGVSRHVLGLAADIEDGVTPGKKLEEIARRVGFRAVGVAKKWVHVDRRTDMDRSWKY